LCDRPARPPRPRLDSGYEWPYGGVGCAGRECLDHTIIFGETHLRRVLHSYASYYNETRTHRSLDKDAPFHRVVQLAGTLKSRSVLGGLHHQYVRI
ncbi:MAG TPA: hypothetical protein VM715_22695, partial [Candidatus Acidoferrum sp.]|nr:hypothetical protein [Candidatus Acidoferrum sp.]